MDADLKLDQGNRYSVALVVFFIPYLLFEVMSFSSSSCLLSLRANHALAALKSGVASIRHRELVGIHRLCLGYCHARPGVIPPPDRFSTHPRGLLVTDRSVGLQGFVKSYEGLIICRLILGFFEAGGVVASRMIRILPANAPKASSQGACISYPAGM
jgi:hypothetical protein